MTIFASPYVKKGIVLDQIAVTGIRVTAYHGVFDHERSTGQLFFADVVAHVAATAASGSDDLTQTVNYSEIADLAASVLGGDAAQLIETVAENIARQVLKLDGVVAVDVRVHKPQAPLHVEFADVTVAIRRDHNSPSLWADRRLAADEAAEKALLDPLEARPERPVTAVIGFGGNLGDAQHTLTRAAEDLHRVPGVKVVATSVLITSKPVGGVEQPDFYNAVLKVETDLPARQLLAACQGIELVHGRVRDIANGPRTLDIDIIDYNSLVTDDIELTLPHPRAHERSFVMVPWAAMDPAAVLPGENGGNVAEIAQSLGTEGLVVAANPWIAQPLTGHRPSLDPALY